jgi:NADPH:quinone reductase-like Zn-dependent oxidoreductase
MKAAVHTSYGAPDVVRIAEVDKPAPKDNELLVRVHATTVNRTDCGFRAARPFFVRLLTGVRRPRITVLGTEFAGVVEAVGGGVTSFAVGERVFGFKGVPFGAHAEYLTIPEDGLVATMPAGVSFEEAAPPAPRGRTMPSRSSGRPGSAAARTSWSSGPPEPSARRPSSSCGISGPWMRWARAPSAAAGDC